MDGRIVICFRVLSSGAGSARGFLERARALDTRARVRGGSLVGWDGARVAFAFDAESLPEALGLVTEKGEDLAPGEPPWCVGIAQGPLEPLGEGRGELAWGPALAAASALATAARPGEILCAPTVGALIDGSLVTTGSRVGRDGALRVRGMRLDPARPLRKQAALELARMQTPPLVGAPQRREPIAPGSLLVVRADPGTGGTRWLSELATASPSRALVVSPSGSGFEPLGALRRALGRSLTHDLNPLLLELAEPLEALLSGEGVSLDMAARLVSAFHWRKSEGGAPGVALLDDAKAIDPASLEACVRAARAGSATFGVVARLDATGGLPSALAALAKETEVDLAPLGREDAEALAGGCTNEALDAEGRRRWARLGGNVPLGVVEAVAYGIVSADLAWSGDRALPRSRAAGKGKIRSASEWITLRARDEGEACRAVLAAVALLGGEAKMTRLSRVLERAGKAIDLGATVADAVRARWLVDTHEDWVGLPSRTHREALATLFDEEARKALHLATAAVLDEEEGDFGRVEAAWHAAQAGDAKRASTILLAAARKTAEGRLDASTTQLIAFARRIDPACEEPALELLANALSRSSLPSPRGVSFVAPSRGREPNIEIVLPSPGSMPADALRDTRRGDTFPELPPSQDSEPPTMIQVPRATGAVSIPVEPLTTTPSVPPGVAGTNIASRLGELAREALLAGDNAALERWVDGLRAAGESAVFTERMRAMARLGRGDIGDALRVLRRARVEIDPADHRRRCQTSLALGVALSAAGRPEEALLEGLDALARARQIGDAPGEKACLAFLAKLFASVARAEDAARLAAAG